MIVCSRAPRRLPGWSRPAGAIAFTSVVGRDLAKAKRRPALQRLLLHATARGVGAAFHTQPVEIPAIRKRIRAESTGHAHPHVPLRLGSGGFF